MDQIRLMVLAFLLVWQLDCAQGEVQILTWDDLLSGEESLIENPIDQLSEEQLLDLGIVVRIRELIAQGVISPDSQDALEEKELVTRLIDQGVEVDFLLSQRTKIIEDRERQSRTGDRRLHEKRVKIPGFMLPIRWENERVTDFLLVPWVGACIHTPPPGANQMVHVRAEGGVENKGRYAAIWIEGIIRIEPSSYDLFLVDGSRQVDVTYTLLLDRMTDYSSSESDVLAQVKIPDSLSANHSWLQRMQIESEILFSKTMTDIRDLETMGAMLWGVLVAFLYGVLHTLGPGHGKGVVIAYFIGEGGSLWKGLRMGGQIAIFHVLSAIAVVLVADFAIRQGTGHAPSDYRMIRLGSYISIVVIGGWMLVKAVRSLSRERSQQDHVHEGHHHDHCECTKHLENPKRGGGFLSVAIGAVPCTGAILVLLFGLANDLLWSSVAMVVAISLGMALALGVIGIVAILGRRVVERRSHSVRRAKLFGILRVCSAVAILAVGMILFLATFTGTMPG